MSTLADPPRSAPPPRAPRPPVARARRALGAALHEGLAQARAGGRRTLLAAAGVAVAALMLGVAVTVSFSLATGFDRSAEAADLPDVIARFDEERRSRVDARLRALPNVTDVGYRREFTNTALAGGTGSTGRGVAHLVGDGRRGYAVVEGRDLSGSLDEVVVERGVADAWGIELGDRMRVEDFDPEVVGIAVGPDNVAYPLASAPRVYVGGDDRFFDRVGVNLAMAWTADPERVDLTLQQARASSFGITDLRFITREGVQVLLDRAAGVVLALLIAFSVVVLGAAGVMLGSAAHADVQRRLQTIGVQRALGFPRATIVGAHAARAALVALPSAAVGLALGALVAAGPTGDLLATLNELPPGGALVGPLALALVATVALVAGASAWPAWRATAGSPIGLLRGGELAGRPPRPPRGRTLAGPFRLGARLAAARRARFVGTVLVLATCVAVVALLLALASLLTALRDDPGALGKRYDVAVAGLLEEDVPAVERIAGVEAAAPRYDVQGADSYALGEPVRLIAFPGDHTRFEAPPLAEGRRLRAAGEAEVGAGLASALNLRVGGRLAVQLESGGEVRFRVVGIVRALDDEGRVAYVRPSRLLAADPLAEPQIAIRLAPDADEAAVNRGLRALGARPLAVGGATSDSATLLATLAALLRAVAGVTALVCLYALVQGLALVALERRPTIALLRASGAGTRTVALLLAGVVAVAAVPAALLGLLAERVALAPAVGALAAGYADVVPAVGLGQALLVTGGLALLCVVAAALVARRTVREPIVPGLRAQ